MLDRKSMFPEGFHFTLPSFTPSLTKLSIPKRLCDVKGVRYYFTNFGLSTRVADNEPRLVTGISTAARDIPKLSNTKSYDPFAVDVCALGRIYLKLFVGTRSSVSQFYF